MERPGNRATHRGYTAWTLGLISKGLPTLTSKEARKRDDPFCRVIAGGPLAKGSLQHESFSGKQMKQRRQPAAATRVGTQGWVRAFLLPYPPTPTPTPPHAPNAPALSATRSLGHFSLFFSFLKIIFRNSLGPGNLNISTESFFSCGVFFEVDRNEAGISQTEREEMVNTLKISLEERSFIFLLRWA